MCAFEQFPLKLEQGGMAGVGKPHISCMIQCTDWLSLAFIDWRSGAVKVGQVGGFKVSRQDALDLTGQWPCGHPGEQGELVRF